MANKYDLKTWAKIDLVATVTGHADGTNIGGSKVGSGKTRFLTYIRVTRHADVSASATLASLTIGIGEATTSMPSASMVLYATNLKLPLLFPYTSLAADGAAKPEPSIMQEMQGSIEHPILSIGAGKFMGIAASLTNGELADVFAVYYDD